ncbi:MAG TPA: S8/S53 family peptidase [Clostridia bacterium]
MKYLMLLFCLLSFSATAKTIKVAILDTGFDFKYKNRVKLCDSGHADLTKTSLRDTHGHGTNVAGLISKDLEKIDYCLVIIKFYAGSDHPMNGINFLKALKIVADSKPDIVNISAGGPVFSQIEKTIVHQILSNGTIMIAASGNNGINLNKNCNFYPACYYPEIIVIGNTNKNSNTGKVVDFYVNGNNVANFGERMTGSSQSAAIYTNRKIKELSLGKN